MEMNNIKSKLIAIFTLRINRTTHGKRIALIDDGIWNSVGKSNINTR